MKLKLAKGYVEVLFDADVEKTVRAEKQSVIEQGKKQYPDKDKDKKTYFRKLQLPFYYNRLKTE